MAGRVENINKDILRQCREQIGLSLSEVKKNIAKIAEIEQGEHKPTFNQLNTLAGLYNVPRWVFISDRLPEEYQFDKTIPAFRQLAESNADVFSDNKVRTLTAKVESFRRLIIELHEDMGEPVPAFNPPQINDNTTPDRAAHIVREWLNPSNEHNNFADWKKELEQKGIFVFMTDKFKGWSHVDRTLFRGLTIYHNSLPIIIINDSDANKAQLFSLFHELGHLLRKESTVDDWEEPVHTIERWCDELAGNVLMPAEQFLTVAENVGTDDLKAVKRIAKVFQVSPYACLVRLKQLELIDWPIYKQLEAQLKAEYRRLQKKLKESDSGLPRNRPREILHQYGQVYTRAIFQAYHNKEIGIHKLCRLFNLKNPTYALDLEGYL